MAETTLLAWLVDPGEMRKFAVGGATDNFASDVTEFSSTIGVGNDLGWADKSADKKEGNSKIDNQL